MKEFQPKFKPNQIRHFLNQQILTGRHNGKFLQNGVKREKPVKEGVIFEKK